MSDTKGNGGSEYADGLLEKILDRHNMNRAYKKVIVMDFVRDGVQNKMYNYFH